MTTKSAKDPTDKGPEDKSTEVETPPSTETPPVEKVEQPSEREVVGKKPSVPTLQEVQEKLTVAEEQLTTTRANLKQVSTELNEERNKKNDFEGLRQTVEQQGANVELIVDVLGSMAEGNEDLQAKVKKSQEEIGKRTVAQKQFQSTFAQMGGIAQIAGMLPQDEALKPAFEALNKGDHPLALNLTTLAVQAKVSTAGFKPPGAEEPSAEEKAKEKKKLPVSTSTSTAPQDWRSASPKQKIQDGLREAREES